MYWVVVGCVIKQHTLHWFACVECKDDIKWGSYVAEQWAQKDLDTGQMSKENCFRRT